MSSETVMKQFGPAEGSETVPQLFLLLDAISVGYRPIVTEEKSVRARSLSTNLCRDDLVDLAIGFLIAQVVNFLVRLVPEVTLTHHVSRKTSHLILLDRYGTKNRSESCWLLDTATFASTSRISGRFCHY